MIYGGVDIGVKSCGVAIVSSKNLLAVADVPTIRVHNWFSYWHSNLSAKAIVIETSYHGKNVQTTIKLAQAAGEVIGALRVVLPNIKLYPTLATVWQRDMFGFRGKKSPPRAKLREMAKYAFGARWTIDGQTPHQMDAALMAAWIMERDRCCILKG